MRPKRYVADFDSTTAMLNALSATLEEREFRGAGTLPERLLPVLSIVTPLVDRLPVRLRERLWAWSGWLEAIGEDDTARIDGEAVAEWFAERYRGRRYPAVFIGSANGALIHLAAALRAAWLPQNFLVPVRHGGAGHADRPHDAIEWARDPGRRLLDANPDLALHQMHDPVQDRPMLNHMAFFRLKRMRLGQAYRRLVERSLEPGGTIFIVDCSRRWPGTRVQDRHVFQFGGMGTVTPDEYRSGSERLARFLERYGGDVRSWDPPEPDNDYPEGEWGFEESIVHDLVELARDGGYRLRRIRFTEPEDTGPLVADLHRWWYERLGRPTDRLLVETFLLVAPYRVLRSALVPLWLKFTTEASADSLAAYLDRTPAFDEIDLLLFQHGVRSAGLASIERWRELLTRARQGRFVALRPVRHPSSTSTYVLYADELRRLAGQQALPPRLELAELDEFLASDAAASGRSRVSWTEELAAAAAQPVGASSSGPA